jgi:hypothetical protein
MAGIALRVGIDVVTWFGSCRHQVGSTVAGCTITRRTFKDIIDVAGSTTSRRMRASQIETRFNVIEFISD